MHVCIDICMSQCPLSMSIPCELCRKSKSFVFMRLCSYAVMFDICTSYCLCLCLPSELGSINLWLLFFNCYAFMIFLYWYLYVSLSIVYAYPSSIVLEIEVLLCFYDVMLMHLFTDVYLRGLWMEIYVFCCLGVEVRMPLCNDMYLVVRLY